MKNIITLFICTLATLPLLSYGQGNGCSGQFSLTYPTGNTTATVNVNNGSGAVNATYCPNSSGAQTLVIAPTSRGTLTLKRTINNGTPEVIGTKVTTIGGGDVAGSGNYAFSLPVATVGVVYTIESVIDCNNTKNQTVSFTLTPSLTLSASLTTVCAGSSSTLTATGSTSGSYTWSAPGMTDVINTGSLLETPPVTTTYTVTAVTGTGTTSCGTTSQQITIFVPQLTASSTATTVCPSTSITLSAATNVAGATLNWTAITSSGSTAAGSGNTITATPSVSTTYRVTASNSDGCTNASTRDVPVTVAAQMLSVNPPAPVIIKGNSATMTAASNISGASYTWRTGGTGGTVVGTGASFTTTPPATTTYTVTSTAGTCVSSQNVTVTVNNPLPVELVSFDVRQAKQGALLTWATGSEQNNAYFVVERSRDGQAFESVGRVAGAGSSSARTAYNYLDAQAGHQTSPTLYYRLQQVDASGRSSYSVVKAVRNSPGTEALTVSVYPNPFEEAPMLRLETIEAGPVTCTVHDVLGRPLFRYSFLATEGLQVLPLPVGATPQAGLYYLQVRQGNQQKVVRLQQR